MLLKLIITTPVVYTAYRYRLGFSDNAGTVPNNNNAVLWIRTGSMRIRSGSIGFDEHK
jgi:hypothetical protein